MVLEHFSGNRWPTLGVEIELQLIDRATMALTCAVDRVLADLPAGLRDSVKPEFMQCYIEVNSDACRTVGEVERDLAARVRGIEEVAARRGIGLFWGGTHPFSHWREQAITPDARYRELAESLQETVRRPVTFGLHVHVGVACGDTAMRVIHRLQEHLPALLALSANSPFWCGRATGLHAYRIELLEDFPTGGLPPLLRDWGEYRALVGRMAAYGFIKTEKELWWDVRPSAAHGTVEVRICDIPPDLPSVLGLAALIQCLVADLSRSEEEGCGPIAGDSFPLFVRQNRWRAARYGLDADLVDLRDGRAAPARQVVKGLVERLGDVAADLGCSAQLELARAMAEGPSGSERQLAIHARTGNLADVVRQQVDGRPHRAGSCALGTIAAVPKLGGNNAVGGSWLCPTIVPGTRGLVVLD